MTSRNINIEEVNKRTIKLLLTFISFSLCFQVKLPFALCFTLSQQTENYDFSLHKIKVLLFSLAKNLFIFASKFSNSRRNHSHYNINKSDIISDLEKKMLVLQVYEKNFVLKR